MKHIFINSLFLSALCYISMDESYFTSIYRITDIKGKNSDISCMFTIKKINGDAKLQCQQAS